MTTASERLAEISRLKTELEAAKKREAELVAKMNAVATRPAYRFELLPVHPTYGQGAVLKCGGKTKDTAHSLSVWARIYSDEAVLAFEEHIRPTMDKAGIKAS